MAHGGLASIVVLLALAVVVVGLFRRCRLPAVLGYLCVGIIAGPHTLGWVSDNEAVHFLGELGVAFLLFTIGLEFSIPQFWAMRRTLLGLGGVQVLVGTVSGGLIAWLIGMPWQTALIVGGALSMSSTAIVIKQLTDQLELNTTHGQLALGILLFQDLAAVPFLVMIPILAAGDQAMLGPMLLALVKAVAAFAIMLLLGRWLLRPLFYEVTRSRTPEFFTLTVLLVSLAAAWLTALMGLSLALGAFIAGMMLSETEYRHQIEVDIRPFRDVLLGLFFITVGMQLDPQLLPPLWPWITLLVVGLVLGKGPLIVLLTRLSGYHWREALRTGTVLAHGGEFGFALLALALNVGLLDSADSQPILAAVIVSMMLAPMMVGHNSLPGDKLLGAGYAPDTAPVGGPGEHGLSDHIIVCGYGRVGKTLIPLLGEEGHQVVALDRDPLHIKQAWEAGETVYYGDATQSDMLMAAGLPTARALVISFADDEQSLKILHSVQQLRPDLPVVVRTQDDRQLHRLLAAGAAEVVPETLEASLMLVVQVLLLLGLPVDKTLLRTQTVRDDRYRLLRPGDGQH